MWALKMEIQQESGRTWRMKILVDQFYTFFDAKCFIIIWVKIQHDAIPEKNSTYIPLYNYVLSDVVASGSSLHKISNV